MGRNEHTCVPKGIQPQEEEQVRPVWITWAVSAMSC